MRFEITPIEVLLWSTHLISGDSCRTYPTVQSYSEVDVDESLRSKGRYVAIGYPASKTKVHYREGILGVKPFALATASAEPETYVAVGLKQSTHLVLKYDRASVQWLDSVQRHGPLPNGMSGGGVWRVENVDPHPPMAEHAKLVAIMIAHRPSENLIISTRIALILEGIRVRYPELSDAIPRTRAIRLNVRRG